MNDLTGGVIQDIGPLVDGIGRHYAITGIAFVTPSLLYGVTTNGSATDRRWLVQIDPNTARVTPIGKLNTVNNAPLGDITWDKTTSTMYGANAVGGALYTINLSTGKATRVSSGNTPLPPSAGHGIAAASDGTLFTTPDGANGDLYTYNKGNGSGNFIAGLSGAPEPSGSIAALAFDEELPTLYGVNLGPAHLVTIDKMTGAITDIGPTVSNLDAIAFVPEPSSIALMSIGGLGLLSWAWKHRRKNGR